MWIPTIHGLIERRLLINYRVDADALQRALPAPFRVKTCAGYGIAGICLIRLTRMRPRGLPGLLGLTSENAAHRVAVEWETADGVRDGVYIPRRDTSSLANTLVGGRLFPGKHYRSRFDVHDTGDDIRVALESADSATRVIVEAEPTDRLPTNSIFPSIEAASTFFERGSIGYSATDRSGCFDCLELRSRNWHVEPLAVRRVESSFFANQAVFPPGTAEFDCALLMRGIDHEWHAHAPLQVAAG